MVGLCTTWCKQEKFGYVSLVALLLLLTVIAGCTNQPTTTLTPPTQPTHIATTVLSSGPALLGSDISLFTATYGIPNSHSQPNSGLYHYQTYAGQNIDFLIIMTDGADTGYTTRVESISVQAPESKWTMTEASTKCAVFLPRDATYKNEIPVATGPALDKIYFSQSLAQQFPVDAFTDANQNPVTPGYFDVQYLYTDTSQTSIAGCSIILGEQQTK